MTQLATTQPAPADHRGPVTGAEQALAPDLIRGGMLLLIGLANAANFAFAYQPGLNGSPHGLERILNFLKITLVDARAYPVFAVMFGYGLVQLARRQRNSGTTASGVRKILLKRNSWLIAFGLVHATLLYFGDFLGAYGIVGIICTLVLLNRGDRFHKIVLWIWGAQVVYVLVAAARSVLAIVNSTGPAHVMTNKPNPSLAATNYGTSIVDRLHEYPTHTAFVLGFTVIVWLGIWAARKQVLENPLAHKALLTRVAIVGMSITVLGGLPQALVAMRLAARRHRRDGLDGLPAQHQRSVRWSWVHRAVRPAGREADREPPSCRARRTGAGDLRPRAAVDVRLPVPVSGLAGAAGALHAQPG